MQALTGAVIASCRQASDAEFIAAANPSVVVALLEENERFRSALLEITALEGAGGAYRDSHTRTVAITALEGLPEEIET